MFHCFAKPPKLNDSVAHHPAAVEYIRDWYNPVVNVEAEDVSRCAGYFRVDRGIPPDVVYVDHDAEIPRLEQLDDCIRLAQRDDHRTICGEHWVQRFDS